MLYKFLPFTIFISICLSYSQALKYDQLQELKKSSEKLSAENLEVFIKWQKWGCCSACCCSEKLCRQFQTIDKCDSLKSHRSRHGWFGVRKLKSSEKLKNSNLENLFKKIKVLEWEEIKKFPNEFKIVEDLASKLKTTLKIDQKSEKLFQIEDCKNNPQKRDCWALAECMFGHSNMLPEKEIEKIEENDACENVTIFVIREAYNMLSLVPNKLVRLQIDQEIGDGHMNSINYSINGAPVVQLEHINDCEHQTKPVFVHPNGEEIILRLTEEQLFENPKIVVKMSFQNPTYLEIVVELVSTTLKQKTKMAFYDTWFTELFASSLVAVSILLVVVIVLILK